MGEDGLWPNTVGGEPSLYSTAMALVALSAAAKQYSEVVPWVRRSVECLARLQKSDGGLPLTPAGPSSVAASLHSLRAVLAARSLLDDEPAILLDGLAAHLRGRDPARAVQTESSIQDVGLGWGRGLQFDHFNAAWIVVVSSLHPVRLGEDLLRLGAAHLSRLLRPDGCSGTLNGRVASWSTAYALQAISCMLAASSAQDRRADGARLRIVDGILGDNDSFERAAIR